MENSSEFSGKMENFHKFSPPNFSFMKFHVVRNLLSNFHDSQGSHQMFTLNRCRNDPSDSSQLFLDVLTKKPLKTLQISPILLKFKFSTAQRL
jgi:hypothetical protein